MKSDFLQPRFSGARFEEHTLPLEVAKDLAAYEVLLIELAKHLYLQEHPERQRIPKGFAADFHLHLERLDDGSTKPLLSVVMAGDSALDGGTCDSSARKYFERARDLIAECIAAPADQLPLSFPRSLLSHFNQVGRSLLQDEQMDLSTTQGQPALLTPDRRKHLVLAAGKVYERDFELSGTIGEVDWEKSTFRLRLADGRFEVIPMLDSFFPQAREVGGRSRFLVTVKGIANFDSWDNIEKVISVESLDIQPDYQLSARFESLLTLTDGWLDGKGIAPNKAKLMEISEKFVGRYPEELPLPAIIPTPEGNLLFEWDALGDPSVDLHLDTMKADFHAFQPNQTEIEQDYLLTDDASWRIFFCFLSDKIQPLQA